MIRRPPGTVHRFSHEAMATVFEIVVAGRDEPYARQAAVAAFGEVDRVERLFSRFDPSSEISRIGRLGPGATMRVGVETVECLGLAAGLRAETGGAFDINFRSALAPAPGPEGGRRRTRRPRGGASPEELIRIEAVPGGYELVRLSESPSPSRFPLDLDLGAVGKGYALDLALGVLRDWGVENAVLHAGTSTALAAGPGPARSGSGWPVGVGGLWGCPGAPRKLWLRDRALSGSGTEIKGEHVIDPRTGRAAGGHPAAWAIAPSAALADALSTAFMVMTTDEVGSFCGRHPRVWAFVIIAPKKCRIFNAEAAA